MRTSKQGANLPAFVPVHPKDSEILPKCLSGIRRFVSPAPTSLTLITPDPADAQIRRIASQFSATLLADAQVVDTQALANSTVQRKRDDRLGWYVQQVLKWEIRKLVEGDAYFVCDADLAFIRPVRLFDADGRYVLHRMTEFHEPYFKTFQRLIGYEPTRQPSYISHAMIMNKNFVDEIVQTIERNRPGQPWFETLFDILDWDEESAFSEYETYGYFVSRAHPDAISSINVTHKPVPRRWLRWHRLECLLSYFQGYTALAYHNYVA